jgi:hypothetical protein
MEEVELQPVRHDIQHTSIHPEFSVNMARHEFGSSCLGVGIAECSLLVVILLWVLLVSRDKISKFMLCTLAPKIDMPLEMMLVTILSVICKPCC